jgi:O-antigen ligase
MAKKKRSYPASGTSAQQSGSSSAKTNLPVTSGSTDRKGSQAGQRMGAATPTINLPFEVQRGDWTVIILALMMFLTPAIGVPNELMLQDTLKSIVVAFATVCAGLLFFWQQRNRRDALRWHGLMWLPLALMFYALGSMVWSHTFLGGVEAIRWFLFSLMLWLGVNTLSRERTPYLIEGIHWGAFVCSLWTVLQFYFDFTFFPQGPNPASTFVNRNFFAEFVVCTFPFTLYLLAQGKSTSRIALTAFVLGFNVIALMMTGTRGALAAFWILVVLIFPLILVLYRKQFAFYTWDSGRRILACGVLMATILTMGLISSGNPKVISDRSSYGNVTTPFDMAFKRTASISAQDGSLGIRLVMWKATAGMIKAVPFKGVGAGAWEAMLPLYQTEGSQLETDYYVHNEVLQLLAEYGAVGWVFLFALFSYLLVAAWKTLRNKTPDGLAEAPMRAIALASVLALLVVSNIGFPWRLASTGCIFALAPRLFAGSGRFNDGVPGAYRLHQPAGCCNRAKNCHGRKNVVVYYPIQRLQQPKVGQNKKGNADAGKGSHSDQHPLSQDHADARRRAGQVGRLEKRNLGVGVSRRVQALRSGHHVQHSARVRHHREQRESTGIFRAW